VQSTQQAGQITLKAGAPGLTTAALTLQSQPAVLRPAVPASQL